MPENAVFTIREELLDQSSPLKDKSLIYQNAYIRFLEYQEKDMHNHPGHADQLYHTCKDFYTENLKFYKDNQYNLVLTQKNLLNLNSKIQASKDLTEKQLLEKQFFTATIDFNYLMNHQNHLLENLAFYEHCLEHNLKKRNDYIQASKKTAAKTLFVGFLFGSAGKAVHSQLKTEGEEREYRYKHSPTEYEFATEFDRSGKERELNSAQSYLQPLIQTIADRKLSPKEQSLKQTYQQFVYQNELQNRLPQATIIYPYPMDSFTDSAHSVEAAPISASADIQTSVNALTIPSDLFELNFSQGYAEYFIKNAVAHKTIISETDFYKNKSTLLLLAGTSQTAIGSPAWNQALRGMWGKSCDLGGNRAIGTLIVPAYAAAYKGIFILAGPYAPVFQAGAILNRCYNNADALKQDLLGMYNAIIEGKPFEFGEHLVELGYDVAFVRRNGKELYRSAEAAYKQNRLPEWNTAFNKGLEQTQNGLVSSKKSDSKAILPNPKQKALPQAYIPSKINGVYKDAKYHHPNSKGSVKSPCPKNGQMALDISIAVQNKGGAPMEGKRRIAACEGEFVILDRQRPGEYHGHVRKWEDLEDIMQKTLKQNGLVDKNGKIL